MNEPSALIAAEITLQIFVVANCFRELQIEYTQTQKSTSTSPTLPTDNPKAPSNPQTTHPPASTSFANAVAGNSGHQPAPTPPPQKQPRQHNHKQQKSPPRTAEEEEDDDTRDHSWGGLFKGIFSMFKDLAAACTLHST